MKKKNILLSIIVLLMLNMFLVPSISGRIGFGPAEIYTWNQRDTRVIGKAILLNDDPVAKYGVFTLVVPFSHMETFQIMPTEIIHARVICNECEEEMQRHEAIDGYVYGDPLHGVCTKCGSSDLIFFKPIPRDEFNSLSLEGAENFHLEKIDDKTWRTIEQISPGGACSVNILYYASDSYLMENYKTHWEVHLQGTAHEKKEGGGFIVSGIALRVLISFKFPLFLDILTDIKKGEPFTVKVVYGDIHRTWEKIPESTRVIFNGISKPISPDGTVSFLFPETRGDYEYKIEATSDQYYLPIIKMIGTGTYTSGEEESEWWMIFTNMYVIIGIIAVIIVSIIIMLYVSGGGKPSYPRKGRIL